MKAWLRRRLAWLFSSTVMEEGIKVSYPPMLSTVSVGLVVLLPFAIVLSLLLHSPGPWIWCLVLTSFSMNRDLAFAATYREAVIYGKALGRHLAVAEILNAWNDNKTDPRDWLLREAFLGGDVQQAAEQVRRTHRPPEHPP